MKQLKNTKGFIQETIDYVKSNGKIMITLALALSGLTIGLKMLSLRLHPDTKKVLQLRRIIQKSSHDAEKALENLKIQKRIFSEYGHDLNKQKQPSQQLNMVYLLISALKKKQSSKQKQLRNPFLPPFEDGLFITQLQPTHRLLYNKFNIYKDHLLVVTKQYQSQSDQISEMDLKQSILVVKALNGLMFFNSGVQAGSSQPHKHIQVFPAEALQLPIMHSIRQFVKSKSKQYNYEEKTIIQFPGFNFIHGLVLLKPDVSLSDTKKKMYEAYKKLLQVIVKRIVAKDYNLIATQEFVLVVARSKQRAFNQISVNAVGFMGSILFKDQQKLNKYLSLKIKPKNILQDITYPKGYEPQSQNLGDLFF